MDQILAAREERVHRGDAVRILGNLDLKRYGAPEKCGNPSFRGAQRGEISLSVGFSEERFHCAKGAQWRRGLASLEMTVSGDIFQQFC
jgi:hypothetical protein